MLKRLIVSLLCAIFIACFVLAGFSLIYYALPSRKAKASIDLPQTVSDPSTQESPTETTEQTDDAGITYVADVHSSLTLRQTPDTRDDNGTISLPPMTHLSVSEFVEGNSGNSFAYVTVASGEYEGSTGYVNADYITKLGEPTRLVDYNEN